MKLTILGGGGFRVPLVYGALLRDTTSTRVDAVTLQDVDPIRLSAIGQVLRQMAVDHGDAPAVSTTTDLDESLAGADFVFSAVRVGGLTGRTVDERVALDLGVLGQETTGAGGVAYGLRTVPVALSIAEHVRSTCPDAWVINFTNPAGMVTEAMQRVLGDRAIGICDSPISLARRAATALGLDPASTFPDYVGLNHLGWLRRLVHDGRDVLPQLLADGVRLRGIEEARLFGLDWLRGLRAIPNEYLYYYYFTREALTGILGQATRGEFLLRQQSGFYAAVSRRPEEALLEWRRVRTERDRTYMAEVRSGSATGERDPADVAGGGYEGVALAFMAAVMRGERQTMILNVRNGGAVPGMAGDAVVEVPCAVDANGPHPISCGRTNPHQLGLMQQVKAVEQLTIEAACTGSAETAVTAFALHPLVDSVSTARSLLAGYRDSFPELAAALH